ncbi:patched domain-containing protein 3-like [Centruroides vittatus]|uniref:patched domain-containing protein 3-like n=1 Tax=Centruroides vittatus TaxID=120091 RepID=UPI0035101B0A
MKHTKEKKNYIKNFITQSFENLGKQIARHPLYFIIVPLLFSLSFGFGIFKLKLNENIENLLEPDRGRTVDTKIFVENTFPFNSSENFDFARYPNVPKALMIYLLPNNLNENMMNKDILMEIKELDEIVKNTNISINNVEIGYHNVCGIIHKKCFENPISYLISNMDIILSKRKRIKFPVEIDLLTLSYRIYSLNFGGVQTNSKGYVEKVKAMRLVYPFDVSTKWKKEWFEQWTEAAFKNIENHEFQYINPLFDPLWMAIRHSKIIFNDIKSRIVAVVIFLSLFSIISCLSVRMIRSKPWLGLASVVSAGLSIVTSFGLMGIFQVESTYWNICIPFLVIVTEIDDAYVLIACWRITDPKSSVKSRLAYTYSEAGVSITLTSLTNFLAYCIGMTMLFPLVKLFCYYSATCIFFTYIFQITFFGGCMALSGYREEKRLHPFTFRFSEICRQSNQEEDEEFFMKVFKNQIGGVLSYSITKIVVISLYFINLGFGIWGTFSMKRGIDWENMYSYDSPVSKSARTLFTYFGEYAFPVQVIINETLDYSDLSVQQSLEKLTNTFEYNPHIADERFTLSWLRYYKLFQENPVSKYSLRGYNMSDKQDFLDGLYNVFLKFKGANMFSSDILFNENKSDITCSRFILVAKNISGFESETILLENLLKVADLAPFSVLVQTSISTLMEQAIAIQNIIIQLFWVTSLLIIIVFLLFIPNITCAILMAISVVSTITETFGFMNLWNVNLDIFSTMSLILCVGFCVNYPTHIAYSFLKSIHVAPNEKLKDSLYHLGYPIFQGSLTTILGILFLTKDIYVLLVFIKIVFLITIETAFHALLVIPVILSLMSSVSHNTKFTSIFANCKLTRKK